MPIISTSLTVSGHPRPQFHVEAWLPFRNCEMVYSVVLEHTVYQNIYCSQKHSQLESINYQGGRGVSLFVTPMLAVAEQFNYFHISLIRLLKIQISGQYLESCKCQFFLSYISSMLAIQLLKVSILNCSNTSSNPICFI